MGELEEMVDIGNTRLKHRESLKSAPANRWDYIGQAEL